jgi:hypothetical protein
VRRTIIAQHDFGRGVPSPTGMRRIQPQLLVHKYMFLLSK